MTQGSHRDRAVFKSIVTTARIYVSIFGCILDKECFQRIYVTYDAVTLTSVNALGAVCLTVMEVDLVLEYPTAYLLPMHFPLRQILHTDTMAVQRLVPPPFCVRLQLS